MQLYSTAMLKCYKHFKRLTLNFSSHHFRYCCPTRSGSWTSFITLILSLQITLAFLPQNLCTGYSPCLLTLFPHRATWLLPSPPSLCSNVIFSMNATLTTQMKKAPHRLPSHSWSLLFCSITLQLQCNVIPRLRTTFWIHTKAPAGTSPNFHKNTAVIPQGNITFIILCSTDKI